MKKQYPWFPFELTLIFAFSLIFLPLWGLAHSELRSWTDIEGRSIQATPLSKSEEEVTIRREDGFVFTLPLIRLSEADRRWVKAWEPQVPPSAAIDGALVIIETPRSRGSGFLANFHDGVFIVTNQHVIEGVLQRDLQITTLHGERLTPAVIEVSPDQDLARLAVNVPYGLNIRYETAHEAKITAYGNSRGGGVATNSRGKVVGLAHDVIEITAEIVQGNSGGPVIDHDNFAIGVASFVTREHPNSQDWVTLGTRYQEPRRYAIRLRPNLTWRRVDWNSYAAETRRIGDSETFLDHALQLAAAIITDPTQALVLQQDYAEPLQDIVRSHNQHVRRFDSNLGRQVRNETEVRRMNQSQNAAYRARVRRLIEVLDAEVNSHRIGRASPSTPYLAKRITDFENAVKQVNASLEEAIRLERSFYTITYSR